MSVTITKAAADRVLEFGSTTLHVSVAQNGCTGLSYVVTVNDYEEKDSDHLYESNGITIVVPNSTIPYLDGTEIDYSEDLLNGGFKYNNPNVTSECGCGQSFTTGE